MVHFFRQHRGQPFVSSALWDPISRAFVASIERFVATEQVPLVTFEKGQRKDDVAARYLARFEPPEGVLFVGKAQEKTWTFRTQKRRNPVTGKTYPWISLFSALVLFRLPAGFTNAELRAHLAPLLGVVVALLPRGHVTYDLRRLRLRGLIQRVPHSHRYRVTEAGFRTALFFLQLDARILRPGLALITPGAPHANSRLRAAFQKLETEINRVCLQAPIAA